MKYRKLGASDLEISEIALGSWLTTYTQREMLSDSARCIHRALDEGINFFDTANLYGFGAAEVGLRQALAGRSRDSYILGTKLFFPMSETDRGLSREQVEKQLDASLQRLGTDYVDLYQCHRYDENVPLEETMEALTRAVDAGKVRYIGFSQWTAEQIDRAFAMPGVARFVASQPHYSLLWREPEAEIIPACRRHNVSQIVFSPLAQGVLSGKYRPGQPLPADTRASSEEMGRFMGRFLTQEVLEAVAELLPIAEEAGCSLAQFSLAWLLREPNVACAITGASRPEQVSANAVASGLTIDPALFAKAEAIAGRLIWDYETPRREERERFRQKG